MAEADIADFARPEARRSDAGPSPYRMFWRLSILLTSLAWVVPLAAVTAGVYWQDRAEARAADRNAVSRLLGETRLAIEAAIEERASALALVNRERSWGELRDQGRLAATFRNLNQSFGGFIDLGVIDADGTQVRYIGPYDLQGRNYRDQEWFHEVCLRGRHVSEVFMGLRNFPHFVIAFRHEWEGEEFSVLRATIDMKLLTDQFHSPGLDRETEAFLVNGRGVVQTPALTGKKALDPSGIELPVLPSGREVIEERIEAGRRRMIGFTRIEGSPFVLVVARRGRTPLRYWLDVRAGFVLSLLAGAVFACVVMIAGFHLLARRVREADLRRARLFHDMEYTNKLATIGRMAASVAHEINNPLAVINEKAGLLGDLAERAPDQLHRENVLEQVGVIVRSVERCSDVTHRLLGFARRLRPHIELISIGHLLGEVVGFQRTEALHLGITVVLDIPEGLPPIESDRGRLQQVFLNIVSNAFAAVKPGGRIDILAAPAGEKDLRVTIRDNGAGIPPEVLPHIFTPFFSTKGESGTGLGLSITRGIVENLGGRIEVQSRIGEGTSFIVTLPREGVVTGGEAR